MFGKQINYRRKGNKVSITFEKKTVEVTVLTSSIINFFAPVSTNRRASEAVDDLEAASVAFTVAMSENHLTIQTEKLTIRIYNDFIVDIFDHSGHRLCADYRGTSHPFVRRGSGEGIEIAAEEGHRLDPNNDKLTVKVMKALEPDTYFYGLGDKTGHLNKRGYRYRMWNTDDPSPHVESFEVLYKSIPFFMTLRDRQAFGIFFDNTYRSVFDMGKENSAYYYFGAVDGNLDYYFIYGPSVREVIGGYTDLTGATPLPPLWTLGYQQCRWAYAPEKRLIEVADTFREKHIPCDVLYLDIDYMDGYRVFTWDEKKFPDPEKMLRALRERGYKVVTIIDPGVKKDGGYPVYREGLEKGFFVTDKDGIPYVNKVWPGAALFPDFSNELVRKWWAGKQKIMTDIGVAGIWNDMNEPAGFDGPLPDDARFNHNGMRTDHREMHNVYGHLMSKATYEGLKEATGKRPFVVTRAGYAGTQKYATVWTGDNQSIWDHLKMSLPMLMNLGMSGMPFCGSDVGGFSWDCTAELLSRWVQAGCFTPLFRNHSNIFTRDQEPWAFGEETEAINRKYIELRYRLLPYLYDLFHQEESTGLPVIRPLLLHYQEDEKTYELNDQFLCGEEILVAPVVHQGEQARMVYLPQGDDWIDFWTNERFGGGQYMVRETPIDICPIFIKAGSVIPMYPVQQYVGEQTLDELTLDIYPPKNGERCRYIHYQDDGESFAYRDGAFNLYEWTVRTSADRTVAIAMRPLHAGYKNGYRSYRIVVHDAGPIKVLADGSALPFQSDGKQATFTVAADTRRIDVGYE